MAWYRSGGLGGLVEVAAREQVGKGDHSLLSPEQRRALAEEVSTGRFCDASRIRDWIRSGYGVSCETSSVCRRSGGWDAPAGCRAGYVKEDAARQEAWK